MPLSPLRSRTLGLIACIGACAAATPAGAWSEGGTSQIGFSDQPRVCSDGVVHDYGRKLLELPPLSQPPKNGKLPFGPKGISLEATRTQIMVPGNLDSGAFTFWLLTPWAEGDRMLRLNWAVSTRLVAVDGQGQSEGIVAKDEWRLGRVTGRKLRSTDMTLFVPFRPGIYRAEIEFESTVSGKRLGKFSQYLRMLRPRTDARLRIIGSNTVGPGGTIVARVENPGTRQVKFGPGYKLDQYVEGNWLLNVGPEPQYIPNSNWLVDAGLASDCTSISVPPDFADGLYRLRTVLYVGNSQTGHLTTVTREFHVEG